jgi:hypothetical protein
MTEKTSICKDMALELRPRLLRSNNSRTVQLCITSSVWIVTYFEIKSRLVSLPQGSNDLALGALENNMKEYDK